MGEMKRYQITLTGTAPILFHRDNITYSEKIKEWQKDPTNKKMSTPGDDRSPAWTWIGCLYTDGTYITMNADNLATAIREGAAKVPTGKKKGDQSYKKVSQAGIVLDQPEYDFFVNGERIPIASINDLIGDNEFADHIAESEALGFELLVKRAKIGMGKHVRVRPLFRNWQIQGTITVLDEEVFGLTKHILQQIFDQAGMFCGLGDWRPGSPKPGFYGKFVTELKEISL